MNIAIIGSHGVGKADLFESLAGELKPGFIRIEDIGLREVEESKDFFTHMHAQEEILAERICNIQYDTEHGIENVLNSGTVISDLAYLIVGDYSYYEFSFPGNIIDNIKILNNLSSVVMEALDHLYDHDLLFYIPIEDDYGVPSIQTPAPKFLTHQRKIDIIIRFLLENYHVRYVTVKGSVEERKNTVINNVRTIQNIGN